MTQQQTPEQRIFTVNNGRIVGQDGEPDITTVRPDDLVEIDGGKRTILKPVGDVVATDGSIVDLTRDGATELIGGRTVVRLGGVALDEPPIERQ